MEDKYYDCHMHGIGKEEGGLLIALDGLRGSVGGYNNNEILEAASKKKGIIPVQYVKWNFDETYTSIVKYHPRREKYTVADVEKDIIKRKPKAIVIDTLNQPEWEPNDYWKLARKFDTIPFLFSHTGGFDILQFMNIAMYQNNVWIDFSFVQQVFGFCGKKQSLHAITDVMDYGLKEEKIFRKLMFGTDRMRNDEDVSQEILKVYARYKSYNTVVKDNYFNFVNSFSD